MRSTRRSSTRRRGADSPTEQYEAKRLRAGRSTLYRLDLEFRAAALADTPPPLADTTPTDTAEEPEWWREILPSNVAFDPTTAERIGFAEGECDRGCLSWEEHLGAAHAVASSAVETPTPQIPEAIADDLASMASLLGQREWKAACLVGAAALEALLARRLAREPWEDFRNRLLAMSNGKRDDGARWHKPISEWGLYGLIRCAGELGVLSAAGEAVCHEARRARNGIHGHTTCGPAEATAVHGALAAVLDA